MKIFLNDIKRDKKKHFKDAWSISIGPQGAIGPKFKVYIRSMADYRSSKVQTQLESNFSKRFVHKEGKNYNFIILLHTYYYSGSIVHRPA